MKRVFDAICYIALGVVMIIIAVTSAGGMSTGVLVGVWAGALFCVGYGLKVMFSGGSYWIHSAIYLLPMLGVIMLIGLIANAH